MARLVLTPITVIGKYPTLQPAANALDIAFTPAGASFADGAGWTLGSCDVLLVQNLNAGAQTFTISTVIDEYGRTGDITAYSVGIAEFAAFGPVALAGFKQADGQVYIAAAAADVGFAVLRLTP